MGEFLNEYVKDLQTIIPLAIGSALILVIFSILYNRWMTDIGNKKDGYTALFVALGNLVTLLIGVAVFSWKAALIALIAFICSGTGMIIGDIHRSVARRETIIAEFKKPRRKPLPYKASGLINDAYDELTVAERKIGQVMEDKKHELIPLIAVSISKALRHISEAKTTEGD